MGPLSILSILSIPVSYTHLDVYKRQIQNDLNASLHKLDLAKRNLEVNPSSQIMARNEEILREIGECENEIKIRQMDLERCRQEVSSIEKDMKDCLLYTSRCV